MQTYFYELADWLTSRLVAEEVYTCAFSGEDSDFVRFNTSRVRQAGSVQQRQLRLDLIRGRRSCRSTLTLSGVAEIDRARLGRTLETLRERRELLPEDPYLLYSTEVVSSESCKPDRLPDADQACSEILAAGAGRDLVGIYAAGGMHSGFANSLGQRNWHSSFSYNLDWSFYQASDRAVKGSYAGFEWSSRELESRVQRADEQLAVLSKSPKTLRPGRYPVYLAPAAVYEITDILGWGGFSLRAHRTKSTPLLRMIEGDARLHPSVRILENTRDLVAPGFQDAGFMRPDSVTLIDEGSVRDPLVSPRSALEYGVPTNGATAAEAPLSLDIAAGSLPESRVLENLGQGIYVSNLWYLNFSDRSACRVTGMTRFATFWVEGGVIQAPLEAMRFDESLYQMLGEKLDSLTQEREIILDAGTYGSRSFQSAQLPGALIQDLRFTM